MKKCSVCGELKPLSEFAINKEYYKSKARAYKAKKHKEFNELRKTLKCAICGEDRFYCLDFHHVDPSEKETEVTKLIESPRKLKKELEKCIVLCANCHRELHYKERMQV